MSQHAAGLALDLQYSDRAMCLGAIDWLIANSDELGIALVNDYMHGEYGRTWIMFSSSLEMPPKEHHRHQRPLDSY
jgi:hypothetical protein